MLAQPTDTSIPQTIIENYIEPSSDPVTWAISLIAIAVAALVGILTWRQGRALRRIETREHEWEQQDRISAHIEVTRGERRNPVRREGAWTHERTNYIRLRNTGRAPARDISYTVGETKDLSEDQRVQIEQIAESMKNRAWTIRVLHPGEFFDLPFISIRDDLSNAFDFGVVWYDGRSDSQHAKNTLINY